MGGSSKSSSSQSTETNTYTSNTTTTNTTNNNRSLAASIDGFVARDAFAGESISVYSEFTPEVANVLTQAFELLSDAGRGIVNLAENSVAAIAAQNEIRENPNAALTSRALPIIGLGILGTTALYLFVRK